MAVQQLGREEALREILSQRNAPVRNSVGPASGIGSYVAPSVKATSGSGIGAVDPTLDYGLDSEMSGNIAIGGGPATEVPFVTPGFYTGMGEAVGQGLSSVFGYKGPSDEKTQREAIQSYINRDIPQMTDEELAAMEADEAAGIDSQLKQISQSLAEKAPAETVPSAVSEGAFGDKGQADATDTTEEKADDPLEPFGGAGDDVQESPKNPAEEGFAAGMKEYLDALTGEDTGVKSIDEYKKEFADATGISIDGKPDKSAALMTFGLALMQNKAGKGFNVSNMLTALGEAGEKAAPELAAAKRAAKAEQLAAGKYALDARGAAITKAAATRQAVADRVAALADQAYDRDTQLQVEQLKQQGQNLRKQAELEMQAQAAEVERARQAGQFGEPKNLLVGGTDRDKFQVQGQQVGKTDVFKIVNPEGAMNTVEGQIKLASQGLDTAKRMREIAASGDISGGKNLFNSLKLGFEGIISVPFDESKAKNPQAEYKAAVGSMLVQFRRMLTGGEAGNAISDRDVEIIKENLGYLEQYLSGNLTTSSQEIVSRVDQLVGMFEAKLTKHSNMKKDLIRMGQRAGQYQNYDLAQDSDFTDDYSGYTSKVMPDGRIRYSLVNKG